MSLETTLIKLPLLTRLPTPYYIYDEASIRANCQRLLNIQSPYGFQIRYAIKANANSTILRILRKLGIHVDASSLNEALRAKMAGYQPSQITLTSQEILQEAVKISQIKDLVREGMRYTVCSLRQYDFIRTTAMENKLPIGVRIHPGVGSGESATRNTGDKYSCFGVHLNDAAALLERIKADNVEVDELHIHIGSGGSVESWIKNIDIELDIARNYFKSFTLKKINFGGGFKIRRMPDEEEVDIEAVSNYLWKKMKEYGEETGTRPIAVIEPGTFIIANTGYVATRVIDKKKTGEDGFDFVIVDGGMQVNTRPLLYGSRHPFYVVSSKGELKSSEFDKTINDRKEEFVIVGRCCESGDSQSLDEHGHIVPRKMAEPMVGDLVVVGGTGAYCASMTLGNYNSHSQAPQYLYCQDHSIKLIRRPQTIYQIVQNETYEQTAL